MSSQHLPNSACRGSISCIAPRSFEAFWYLKTLVALRHLPLLDFVEVAKLFHEVPRGPSLSQTVCHHSQLAATEFFENGLHTACDVVLIHWNEAAVTWTPDNQGLPQPIHPQQVRSVEDHRVVESVGSAWDATFFLSNNKRKNVRSHPLFLVCLAPRGSLLVALLTRQDEGRPRS